VELWSNPTGKRCDGRALPKDHGHLELVGLRYQIEQRPLALADLQHPWALLGVPLPITSGSGSAVGERLKRRMGPAQKVDQFAAAGRLAIVRRTRLGLCHRASSSRRTIPAEPQRAEAATAKGLHSHFVN
jgi:hypothetical protein